MQLDALTVGNASGVKRELRPNQPTLQPPAFQPHSKGDLGPVCRSPSASTKCHNSRTKLRTKILPASVEVPEPYCGLKLSRRPRDKSKIFRKIILAKPSRFE